MEKCEEKQDENQKQISNWISTNKTELDSVVSKATELNKSLKEELLSEMQTQLSKCLGSVESTNQRYETLESLVQSLKEENTQQLSIQETSISQIKNLIVSKEDISKIIDEKQSTKFSEFDSEIRNMKQQSQDQLEKISN